jgi:threonine synthase
VSDDEVLTTIRQLAREEGVFAEPAGATGHAGLVKAVRENLIGRDEQVVVVITGNGLKDVSSAMKAAGEATLIEPTLEALRRERIGSVP